MENIEFVDGESPVIQSSEYSGSNFELKDSKCAAFGMDFVFAQDKSTSYKPKDGEVFFIIAVYDNKKIFISELVFRNLDFMAKGFSEHGCCFKTREEAERIAEEIEREMNGEFSFYKSGGDNGNC